MGEIGEHPVSPRRKRREGRVVASGGTGHGMQMREGRIGSLPDQEEVEQLAVIRDQRVGAVGLARVGELQMKRGTCAILGGGDHVLEGFEDHLQGVELLLELPPELPSEDRSHHQSEPQSRSCPGPPAASQGRAAIRLGIQSALACGCRRDADHAIREKEAETTQHPAEPEGHRFPGRGHRVHRHHQRSSLGSLH